MITMERLKVVLKECAETPIQYKWTLKDFKDFLKEFDLSSWWDEAVLMDMTLEEYTELLPGGCNMVILELFTGEWVKHHPDQWNVWTAYVYHFRRLCYPDYYFFHLRKYRELKLDCWCPHTGPYARHK